MSEQVPDIQSRYISHETLGRIFDKFWKIIEAIRGPGGMTVHHFEEVLDRALKVAETPLSDKVEAIRGRKKWMNVDCGEQERLLPFTVITKHTPGPILFEDIGLEIDSEACRLIASDEFREVVSDIPKSVDLFRIPHGDLFEDAAYTSDVYETAKVMGFTDFPLETMLYLSLMDLPPTSLMVAMDRDPSAPTRYDEKNPEQCMDHKTLCLEVMEDGTKRLSAITNNRGTKLPLEAVLLFTRV